MTGVLDRSQHVLADPGVCDEIAEDLVCRRVVPVTHDVTSFVLESPTGRRFAFTAGQFVTVAAEIDGRTVERCYTISSPATRTDRITITVKRIPDGPMSNWLHDRLAVGGRVRVTGPLGLFTTAEHPAAKYLFLSAGSGITPLMSMTRTMLDAAPPDVVFVHNARTPRDIVFRAELGRIGAPGTGVRVTHVCEDDAPDEPWDGHRGRLTLPLLLAIAPDLAEREIFVCGPRPYMDAVRAMLREARIDPSRQHEESFVLAGASADAPASTVAAGDATGFGIEFRRSGATVTAQPGETLLQAGLRAGVPLPSSCGEGMCGTCKTPMLEGQVDMQHNGGIRPREIAQNQILLCCSQPLGDVVVDA